jgi:hypothetical protein
MGLRKGDLVDLVDGIFEVDTFQSKMGDDQNIVTLSFSLTDKQAAEDLSNFLEKGYSFILDSDVTSGEQSDGTYKVFVEMERDRNVNDNIFEIVDGITKLSNKEKFRFRYYKDFRSHDATLENLQEYIPNEPEKYGINMQEGALNNYKSFFSRSFLDLTDLSEDNILTIRKKWAEPLKFEFIDFDDTLTILESIQGKFDLMESYAEILFLTKYIGDYNISKYGETLVFENEGKSLVLKRI